MRNSMELSGKAEETNNLIKSMKHISARNNMMFSGGTDMYDVRATSEVGDLIASLGDKDADEGEKE